MIQSGIFAGHQTQLREQVKQIGLQILNKPIKVGKQKQTRKKRLGSQIVQAVKV